MVDLPGRELPISTILLSFAFAVVGAGLRRGLGRDDLPDLKARHALAASPATASIPTPCRLRWSASDPEVGRAPVLGVLIGEPKIPALSLHAADHVADAAPVSSHW
jgi:hypothetical protein